MLRVSLERGTATVQSQIGGVWSFHYSLSLNSFTMLQPFLAFPTLGKHPCIYILVKQNVPGTSVVPMYSAIYVCIVHMPNTPGCMQ